SRAEEREGGPRTLALGADSRIVVSRGLTGRGGGGAGRGSGSGARRSGRARWGGGARRRGDQLHPELPIALEGRLLEIERGVTLQLQVQTRRRRAPGNLHVEGSPSPHP